MSNLRQIRKRIRSIKNIQQITRAMKMVASARLRRAQAQLWEARPYTQKLREVIQDIAACTSELTHPLLQEYPAAHQGRIVVTSDKGLCGGFNTQIILKATRTYLEPIQKGEVEIICIGRKSLDFFRRQGIKPIKAWAGFWQELNWFHADAIGQELIDAYSSGRWSRLTLVYNHFKSALTQEGVEVILLPLTKPWLEKGCGRLRENEFEPSAEAIYHHLLPRYVKISLWHALLESKAAEMAARMQAMDNATENTGEMIAELMLRMNQARQAVITREISELVGSAEAISL